MTTLVAAPLMFISHGAPTFAIEPGILGEQLNHIGQNLSDVKAILVVSPHWQTADIEVMTNPQPETIHDFYGFPKPLYELSYPVKGATDVAKKAIDALKQAGFIVQENPTRGLDHGTWVPLMHLLPNGDIPVFQVSMPKGLDPQSAYELGKTLGPLRKEGVMIIASGSMTHNLHDFRQGVGGDLPYVSSFSDWVKQAVQSERLDQLLAYREFAPGAMRAHPTDEHFLPLFIALGARLGDVNLKTIEGGIEYGILSMDSFAWGLNKSIVSNLVEEDIHEGSEI
ncbi:class III extradiol ring-cleavage dioxygenase [Polynucleobacter sp. AP-RePozz3-80-G7]|uniref:DODA-type extradiol aromatic ring-opening family dioxygenase n=1 Tax=Polynucleobacter sp. AP-RePozz3-80-G7 TaxID=2689105 RepID=UPI001C0D95D1|nr:class III extradiol ring-cleavage dioxygenase [Polynucleobacter sp. AP-RePozz3-80-G7]MBU3638731.1 dioxygenase [Polynucleobacter sp. AP-RePozz3-80-G7]